MLTRWAFLQWDILHWPFLNWYRLLLNFSSCALKFPEFLHENLMPPFWKCCSSYSFTSLSAWLVFLLLYFSFDKVNLHAISLLKCWIIIGFIVWFLLENDLMTSVLWVKKLLSVKSVCFLSATNFYVLNWFYRLLWGSFIYFFDPALALWCQVSLGVL